MSALGLVAALAFGGCGGGEPLDGIHSGLLITLDTTRADALTSYGGRPGLTPNMDALAAEGVRYTRAQTVAPLTLPAHASMLTGLYPLRHGVRDNGLVPVPESATTLAEIASEAGFQTAAFISAVVLDEAFGLAQGFETYETPRGAGSESQSSHFSELPAGVIVDRALDWYTTRDPERPFFLWVHLFDPHGPYEPPPEFSSRVPSNAYLGEVAYMDNEIGRLIEALRSDGGIDSTLIVVVADHGESMGEHQEATHGAYCWQTTMHVPFIVRHPDGYHRGRTNDAIVSVADVHPTLAEGMGLSVGRDLDGISLYRGSVPADRGVYFESYNGLLSYGWSPLSGWIDARGKYLHSSEPQFFVLDEDPGEKKNVIGERAADAARHLTRIQELTHKPTLEAGPSIDDGLAGDIQKLGYTAMGTADGGVPGPLEVEGLPSPQSRIQEQVETLRALSYLDAKRSDLALPILERLVEENPTNWFALDRLTNCLMSLERNEEAIPHLERLLGSGPQWPGTWFNLGLCYEEVERFPDAVDAYARAVELKPNEALFLRKTIKLLRKLNRDDETEPFRVKLRELKQLGRDVGSE